MDITEELGSEINLWQALANDAIGVADSAASDEGVAVDGAGETDTPPAVELKCDELLTQSDVVLAGLRSTLPAGPETDARITAFMTAHLLVAQRVLDSESDVAVDSIAAADALFEMIENVRDPGRTAVSDVAVDAVIEVPTSVHDEFEAIEKAAGDETYALLRDGTIQIAGAELVNGIGGLLSGGTKVAFEAVLDQLHRWRDAVKRFATRVTNWFTEKLLNMLPERIRTAITDKIDDVKESVGGNAGEIIGSGLGVVLGRRRADAAWIAAVAAELDLTAALAAVGTLTDGNIARIGWITKGRGYLDNFGTVVINFVKAAAPQVQIAYFAAVAAIFLFVAWQLWDGIRDIGDLAPDVPAPA